MGADFGDIDGDGLPDIVVTGLVNEGWEVFLNQSSGIFVDSSAQTGILSLSRSSSGWGCGLVDLDNDGWLDAAVTALNSPTELWWNRGPTRHWLQLRLHGRRSNRSAIGAQIACTAANRKQTQWVRSSVGYASSSDLTVHFGLGSAARAAVEIRWPSGLLQNLGDIAADQRLDIAEP
jgi:hypothetical protein